MRENRESLHNLLEICAEQLRLCREGPRSARKLAQLLERKQAAIAAVDFAHLGPGPEVRAQAERIVELEEESIGALRRHRDAAASELKQLSSAKNARAEYLGRSRDAKEPRLIDRAG